MRLSPVLVTMVAIAAPLGSSVANAQTPQQKLVQKLIQHTNKTTDKTTSVIIPTVTAPTVAAPAVTVPTVTVPTVTPSAINTDNTEHQVVAVFPASEALKTIPAGVKPVSKAPNTAQIQSQPNQIQTPLPDPVPVNPATPPNNTQQQAPLNPLQTNPNQAPGTNPSPTNPTNPTNPTQQQAPLPPIVPEGTPGSGTPVLPGTGAPTTQPPSVQPSPQQPNETPQNPSTPQFNLPQNNQPQTPEATEPRVLVSEVQVRPQSGELAPQLEQEVYRVIKTQAGRTTTRSLLQEDINAIFATGFFSNVQALPEDTPLGVRVSFVVQQNPKLTKVQIQANPGTNIASVLPATAIDEIFKEQYGKILNLRDLQEGIKTLTKRYQDQGFVLANVIGAPQVSENGVVTLQVAEGVVENIRVRFRNKDGQETNEKGEPIRGSTQKYIITRELELKPGKIFNRNIVQRDLQRVFGLGLFEDVNVSLDPGSDPSKVDVVVNVVERNSGSIAAGAGISSASGLFGTISYQQQNLNGRNQKLGAELQLSVRDFLFDVRFTDPWIAGDPYRTSYTVNAFRRQSISLLFEGKDNNIETFDPNNPTQEGDRPRVVRTGGGVTFTRPLSSNPFRAAEWVASAGLQYQRVETTDFDGNRRRVGRVNLDPNSEVQLSQSGEGQDDLLLLQLGASRDKRNNPLQPTSGSLLRFGVDQSVPVGLGNIFLTRLRGSYSYYIPVQFTNFTKGPQALAFNFQGGTILGDLPPYEAFSLGGSNSVRGYEEGQLGSGRSYVQASVEYRFPVFSVVSGALFFDVGSDLGTSTRPAEVLNKNGTGYGYGLGVRVQSPLGPIRIDYGINNDGDSRINFGIGERF